MLVGMALVDAAYYVPSLEVELVMATDRNFLGRNVYGDVRACFLQEDAAKMLAKAAAALAKRRPDLRLHAYDCLRPRSVQAKMYALVKGTRQEPYVAPPGKPGSRRGSVHSFGCAIDLTLSRPGAGVLDMGTPYDWFGPESEPRLEARYLAAGRITPDQVANRRLLREVMTQAGFVPFEREWWHFNCAPPHLVPGKYPLVP